MIPSQIVCNKFRAIFLEWNKKCAPDPATRLNMMVDGHFVERLFERFNNEEGAQLCIELREWIRDNYAKMQLENSETVRRNYIARLQTGCATIVLLNGKYSIRTCYKHDSK